MRLQDAMIITRMMDKTSYFESRAAVGQDFGDQLSEYSADDVVILALSQGGAVIAVEIAKKIHGLVTLLLLKHIYLPGERKPLGVVNDQGILTYGQDISPAYIEEFEMEYHSVIENDKMDALHRLHAVGKEGILTPEYFRGKTVIMVNDFTKTGTAFKAAAEFLKPVKAKKIILVTAIAQVPAIDVMHLLGDKIVIAHATDKELPPEHYFQDNTTQTPEVELLVKQIPLKW